MKFKQHAIFSGSLICVKYSAIPIPGISFYRYINLSPSLYSSKTNIRQHPVHACLWKDRMVKLVSWSSCLREYHSSDILDIKCFCLLPRKLSSKTSLCVCETSYKRLPAESELSAYGQSWKCDVFHIMKSSLFAFNMGAYWKSIATVWEDVDHSVHNSWTGAAHFLYRFRKVTDLKANSGLANSIENPLSSKGMFDTSDIQRMQCFW